MKLSINVPTELSDVTLGQYQKFVKIQKANEDPTFIAQKMVEIFCKIDLKDTFKIKVTDINEIVAILNNLFDKKPELITEFKLNNQEYGFIPKLEDISLGEYVDVDTYLADWDNMHLAMNVLYRPIKMKYGGKYDIIDYEAKESDKMKDMTLDVVFSCLIFFYNLGIDLSNNMMDYLMDKRLINHTEEEINSATGGVGMDAFTNSLREILQNSKISLSRD
tara:strand:+ start:1420 stop:2079 length:660 start_codon:yes stop_codon:yes gene_type:complete